jgi:predicted acyl esterase
MDPIIGTGKISRREYKIIANRETAILMSDGVKIDADIFRPDSPGKFPVLVAVSAFNKEIQSRQIWPAPALFPLT